MTAGRRLGALALSAGLLWPAWPEAQQPVPGAPPAGAAGPAAPRPGEGSAAATPAPATPARRWAGPAAARVDGVAISRERLDRFTEEYTASKGRSVAGIQNPAVYRRLVREALDQLIDDELIGQEAVRRGYAPAEAEVEQVVAEVRKGFDPPVQFELRLERSGFDEQGFREHVARQLAASRLVAAEIAPSVAVGDAEVHAWYLEHGAATGQPETAAREVIRERLRGPAVEAAVRARLAGLRRAARIEILVPVEARP